MMEDLSHLCTGMYKILMEGEEGNYLFLLEAQQNKLYLQFQHDFRSDLIDSFLN